MTKRARRADPPQDPAAQMSIAFTTRLELDRQQRTEVVGLLSRLLLQVASAQRQDEVDDDHS
jgi:hypothetical protein